VDLEVYVRGVVAAELPLWSSLPAELQAQSICVRTYTLGALARQSDPEPFLWDGVQDQAYHGIFVPSANQGEQRAAVRLARAVEATRGQVLVANERLVDARYHAACGGYTADRAILFPGAESSPSVECEPCQKRAAIEKQDGPPKRRPLTWEAIWSRTELNRLAKDLGVGRTILGLEPGKQDAGGRWSSIQVQGDERVRDLPLQEWRRATGFGAWKSGSIVSIQATSANDAKQGLRVRGLGRGHGVGLCQEGLHDYAAMGWTDRAILSHYYPGAHVMRVAQRTQY